MTPWRRHIEDTANVLVEEIGAGLVIDDEAVEPRKGPCPRSAHPVRGREAFGESTEKPLWHHAFTAPSVPLPRQIDSSRGCQVHRSCLIRGTE